MSNIEQLIVRHRQPNGSLPLVSCVMPTAGRPEFVAQAIRYFQRQDYPHTELVIAYETPQDIPEKSDDPRISYVLTPSGCSIGAKRNAAVKQSVGAIVAQWDDDDWYSPNRLSAQVEPILQNLADITGLNDTLFLMMYEGICWSVSPTLFSRLFVENVHGGTLTYRRWIWDSLSHYPATSLREDADFLVMAMRKGARLVRLCGRDLYLYVRHQHNSWNFRAGSYLDTSGWSQVGIPDFLGADAGFYRAGINTAPTLSPLHLPVPTLAATALPLVSCIMPTANRREFIPQAIHYFLTQTYAHKELIIVDDGAQKIADLIPAGAPIRYLRMEHTATIGAKRNLACSMAQGTVIAHWDDDDWMAPAWLTCQVATLLRHQADVCGLDKVLFHAPALSKAWKYVYDGVRPWVYGGTLCYTKSFWERNRFADINIGEDNAFVWSRNAKTIEINSDMRSYIATVHAGNTSPKKTCDRRWHAFPANEITRIQHADARSELLSRDYRPSLADNLIKLSVK